MADQTLTIRLKLDKSPAMASSREFHAAERQAIKQTTEGHRSGVKARVDSEKAAFAEILRANREASQQRRRDFRLESKERIDRIREESKEEREAASETARVRARALAEARKSLSETSKALGKRIADENALRVVLTDQQIQERARTELIQKLNRKNIESAKEMLAANSSLFKGLKSGADDSLGSLKGLAAGYVGLQGVAKAVELIGEAWRKVADEQREAHKEFIQILKESRVGAAVSGINPKQYAAGTAAIAIKSGLSLPQADEFNRQFEGTVPIGIQNGNITKELAEQVKAEGARTGARLGGDQATRGELFGILPQFTKIKSVQHAAAIANSVRHALTEGRGDDGPLTRALLQAAGKNDLVGTLEENAALIGTTSLSGGAGQADTIALQMKRAVQGTTAKQAAALEKNFGIKADSQEGLEARLDKMIPKLKELQAKGGNVYSFLRDEIGTPAENIESIVQFMPNYEAFKKRAATARSMANEAAGAGVMRENDEFLKTDLGRQLTAEAEAQAGQLVQGNKLNGFGAFTAKFEGLRKGQDPSFFRNLGEGVEGFLQKPPVIPGLNIPIIPPMTGFGTPAENRANDYLYKMIQDNGLDLPAEVSGIRGGFTPPTQQGAAMMQKLQDAGINPFADVQRTIDSSLAGPLKDLTNEARKQTAELQKLNASPVNARPPNQGRIR